MMETFPPESKLIKFLDANDFFLWEYYGKGFLGRLQAWIFRSRIKELIKLLHRIGKKPKIVLDVGCGPMLISYALSMGKAVEYLGIDIMDANILKRYMRAMRGCGVESIEAVRASAEALPFRKNAFDLALSRRA
jgi:ubiquinone/menaquinone biosynthesis C-methylase UbiE